MAFPSGADYLHRLNLLAPLIRKYMKTENIKYLKQAYQICNDTEPKIRKFKRMVNRRMEEIRRKKIEEKNEKD